MRRDHNIAVIIPALNEEEGIGRVLGDLPGWVDDVVVVDNGSSDGTAAAARAGGARVIDEPHRGYGAACLAGIASLKEPDLVVFLDADFSDHPEEMDSLVDPILDDAADLVIGSRDRNRREPGALTLQSRFGNWLTCHIVHLFWGTKYTDLGPFRAIRLSSLVALGMEDTDYGWTIEMQIKAARLGLRVLEVPVSYRKRIGKSKISGTVRGTLAAGFKILRVICRHAVTKRNDKPSSRA